MKGIDQNLEKYISDQDITKRVKEISNIKDAEFEKIVKDKVINLCNQFPIYN